MAGAIGVDPSTVYRELKRVTEGKEYNAKRAHEDAIQRRQSADKAIKITPVVIAEIEKRLSEAWRPEQISTRLKTEGIAVSHAWIDQHVYADKKQGGTLSYHRRHAHKQRKKRYGRPDKRGHIKGRVSIDERPKVVDEKTRLGDWAMDTVIGKHHPQGLVTIVERCSKKTLIGKVVNQRAEDVSKRTVKLLMPYKDWVHTITADNGKAFAYHETISQS